MPKQRQRDNWRVISVPWNERDGDGADWFVVYWPSWGGVRQSRECKDREAAFKLCRKLNKEGAKP